MEYTPISGSQSSLAADRASLGLTDRRRRPRRVGLSRRPSGYAARRRVLPDQCLTYAQRPLAPIPANTARRASSKWKGATDQDHRDGSAIRRRRGRDREIDADVMRRVHGAMRCRQRRRRHSISSPPTSMPTGLRMAELTYRDAVARGITWETRDPDVIFFSETSPRPAGLQDHSRAFRAVRRARARLRSPNRRSWARPWARR